MYFSKLAKVLLAGAAIVTVGCTDYKDDIASINDRLDNDIVAGMIEPLQADLEKAVADLEAAQAALKAELTTKHDADVKTLQDADAALDGKIAAANQSILDLQAALAAEKAALQAEIDALEVALEAAKKAATDADAALKAELVKEITDLETELLAKITALETKHNEEIAALAKKVDENKAAADAEFAKVAGQISDLNAKDAELEAELAKQAKAIEDLDAKVDANYAELSATIEAVRKNLQEQVYANKAAIDANKASINAVAAGLETLTADVRALEQKVYGIEGDLVAHLEEYANYKALVAGKLAALEAAHAALEARVADLENVVIPAIKAQIAENAKLANANAAEIAKNAALFEQYKQAAQQTYAELVAADETLALSIALLGEQVDGIAADLAAYKATIAGELADHYEAFEQFKNETDERISDAVAKEMAHYQELTAKHNAQEAALAQLQAFLQQEIAERKAADAALQASIDSLNIRLDAVTARVAVLEAGLADLKAAHEALANEYAAFKKEITTSLINAINALQEQMVLSNAAIYGTIAELQAHVDAEVAALKEADKNLQNAIAAEKKAREEAIAAEKKAREDADAALQEQITSILGMIQSVVYVPDYTDGKATVDYAHLVSPLGEMFVVEGYSQITYQVYPAECADALAVLTPEKAADYLSLQLTDELKVRNAAVNGPALKVVAVEKGKKEGYIVVTYQANNLGQAFYDGKVEYAVSLHIDSNNSCLSSCYTNLVAASEPKVEIVPAIVPTVAVAQEIEYLKPGVANALPLFPEGLAVVYNVNSEVYNLAQMQEAGWVLAETPATPKKIVYNVDATKYTGTKTLFEAGNVENVENYWLAADVKAEHVGMYADHYRGFTINGQVTLYSVSTLEIAPDTAVVPFNAIHFKWYYTADAAQDAATTPNYARTDVALTVNEDYYTENPDDKTDLTWEEITAVTPVVTVNGQPMGDTVFTLKVDDGKPVVDVTNFTWKNANGEPMTYDVTFKYSLPAATVKVTVKVTTEDRSREKMTFEYGKFSYEFLRNMEFLPFAGSPVIAPRLGLNGIYERINAAYHLGLIYDSDVEAIDAERQSAFLTEVFVNNAYEAAYKRVATGFEGETATKLVAEDVIKHIGIQVDDTAKAVSLGYSYKAYDFIPKTIDYTVTYTLWYGQEVEIHATVELTVPTKYNFEYSYLYVKNGKSCGDAHTFTGLFSSVYPFYDPDLKSEANNTNGVKLRDFNTEKVDMNKAFDIVNTEYTDPEQRILTEEQITEAGLVAEFELEETYDFSEYNAGKDVDAHRVLDWAKDELTGEKTNKLIYNADPCHAAVTGNLYILCSNGLKMQLPTNFDTAADYQNYVVKKYDPILDPVLVGASGAKAPEADTIKGNDYIDIKITSAIEYVLNPLLCIELKDYRNGYKNHYLINRTTGEWVVGGKSSVYDGFAEGRDVRDIYKLDIEWAESSVPAKLRKVIYMTPDNKVVFDNTGEQVLVEPFVYTVTLKITSPWGTHKVEIPFRFYQGGDLGEGQN